MAPKHPQVSFKMANGHAVRVDEGVLDLMCALRDHGVHTFYSCQGDDGRDGFRAYFLADTKSLRPLMTKIERAYDEGRLTKESTFFVTFFIRGFRERRWTLFENQRAELSLKRGIKHPNGYAIERTWSPTYGSRTSVRWPHDRTDRFLALLAEID